MWMTVFFSALALNILLKLVNIIFNKRILWLKYLSNGYALVMFVFMFCWLIYGNVLYFSEENDCGDYETTHGWNVFFLIILIIGYIQMAVMLLLACVLGCALFVYYRHREEYNRENNIISERDAVNLANGLMRTEFDSAKHKYHTSCIICLVDF